jgi:hypothetical protein
MDFYDFVKFAGLIYFLCFKNLFSGVLQGVFLFKNLAKRYGRKY